MATVWKPGNCVLVICGIRGTVQVSMQAHFDEMENLPIWTLTPYIELSGS